MGPSCALEVSSRLDAVELKAPAGQFLALHRPGEPLLQPNAWDIGSARLLEGLGFAAIATTSGGFAASLGRLDGKASRDEVLTQCAQLAQAVTIPVAADAENGFSRRSPRRGRVRDHGFYNRPRRVLNRGLHPALG